ncbi:MAG: HhH-GPD-type base excision DNA repair protein [Acidimicrobiales bacterium]
MLEITGDAEADKFVSEDPLGLLIAMVLDQQIPLERAFKSPADLKERLGGTLDVGAVAAMDPDQLAALFSIPPALHRFPGSMARRVQELCQLIVNDYGSDAAAVWTSAGDGAALLANVKALPGFGEQKARIFVALLGKQFGVRPPGWEEASSPFGEPGSFRSVADIDSRDALAKVRQYKQQMKAEAKATAAVKTSVKKSGKATIKVTAKVPGKAAVKQTAVATKRTAKVPAAVTTKKSAKVNATTKVPGTPGATATGTA